MMWNDWGGGYGYGMAWFGVLHLVWWVVLIAAGAAVLRWVLGSGGGGAPHGADRARAIVRERYARGEIDKGEFDERMRNLKD